MVGAGVKVEGEGGRRAVIRVLNKQLYELKQRLTETNYIRSNIYVCMLWLLIQITLNTSTKYVCVCRYWCVCVCVCVGVCVLLDMVKQMR